MYSRTLLAILIGASLTACEKSAPSHVQAPDIEHTKQALFVDATPSSGLDFVHRALPSMERHLPEIVGAGVALFDYDQDGDLDIYFLQGGHAVGQPENLDYTNRLFRNNLNDQGVLTFTDVSEAAGVDHAGYGMGVACADIDNDGDTDFYVTNLGDNVLYQNQGNGVFIDITASAQVNDPRWSTSASFADIDNDGLLDLFVTNYVAHRVESNQACKNLVDQLDYCSPTVYPGTSDSLFLNSGDGTFKNISDTSGIQDAKAAGLGVIAADFDRDGLQDFFVANDQTANFLWMNLGAGRFRESGLISGSAYNGHGMAEASMGIAAEDFDADGDVDLFMTHLNTQTNTLYTNDGDAYFSDTTGKAQLDNASLRFTGFGTHWFDVDNDGDLDVFVANGAVIMEPAQVSLSDFPYAQRNQLFLNNGKGRYQEWRGNDDSPLQALGVSRGSAVGDIDNDGDLDLVISNANGEAQLLLNTSSTDIPWFGVQLQGSVSNRDGTGAQIAILSQNSPPKWRRAHSDGSFLSANDARVHIGLTAEDAAKSVSIGVIWPAGTREQWHALPRGRYTVLIEGQGESWVD